MKKTLLSAAVTLALTGVLPLRAQTTWFVDVTGVPPGNGTPAAPYTSIQFAIDQAATQHGDALEVRQGTYVENVNLTKRLTMTGAEGPAGTVILASSPGPVVRLASGGDIRVEWLTIAGGQGALGDGVEVVSGTTAVVSRCILRDNERHGLFSNYDVTVDRCTVVRNGARSLIVTPFPNGMTATHNILVENGMEPDFGSLLGSIAWNIIDMGAFGDVTGDPSFWNSAADDFHLRADSAAIDAGSTSLNQQDPDGSPADLGAHVFDPLHPTAPIVYCTAKLNSQGCTPSIASSGIPSASGSPFTITCDQVLNQRSGLLFYGFDGKATPYQGGWLCVRAPARRTPLQNSGGNPNPPTDCSGVYSFDFDARIQSGNDPSLAAGASVYVQHWYRDPTNTSGFPTGRSDALYFLIGP